MNKEFKIKKKVAVAMSGGVDSAVAAARLVKAGYDCVGFHMKLWGNSNGRPGNTETLPCRQAGLKFTETLRTARRVAKKLEIRLVVVDLRKEFKKRVVDYFCEAYGRGLTPNPCVVCNQLIKFGELLKHARKLGCDYLATGHYARIAIEVRGSLFSKTQAGKKSGLKNHYFLLNDLPTRSSEVKSDCNLTADQYFSKRTPLPLYHLLMARDKKKDQSYFLYRLNQEQLSHVLFPNGDYLKSEVKEMAARWGLPVKEVAESQEICFLGGHDYREFLKDRIGNRIKGGEVVDGQGRIIGEHFGLPLYTIGQRTGFKIYHRVFGRLKNKVPVLYVIGKEVKKNRLVVGRRNEVERREFEVKDISWVNANYELGIKNKEFKCRIKIRNQGKLLKCKIHGERGRIRVFLEEGERGVAKGQSAVFYSKLKTQNSHLRPLKTDFGGQAKLKTDEYEVVGGGEIR